ncbi:MAG: hypothetical protein HY543_02000 [Deltaproteobacteria bacterium]|nr:hypothetical protein [Deltaproteobacteria bacterium]
MPVDAAAAKLGAEALQASQKATGTPKDSAAPISAGTDSPFQQLMNQMDTGAKFAESIGVLPADLQNGPGEIQALSAEGIAPTPEWLDPHGMSPTGAEHVVSLLSEVNHGQMQMDHLLNEILYGGKKFSNQELLAIQAHIYHFAQMTELTVKVAEQGLSSVKTILNTQVQ